MAANIAQIFPKVGDIQWNTVKLANTARNGTGVVATIFVADATNGGHIGAIRFVPLGTNVETVARIFINNGSTNATAANNTLYDEVQLPATGASEEVALVPIESRSPLVLPPGYKLNVVLGTAVAAGYSVTALGGKF